MTKSPSDMRALASDVANVARGAGYGLATAWIPPQRVSNGVLRVVIDEGRIDAIEAEVEELKDAVFVGLGAASMAHLSDAGVPFPLGLLLTGLVAGSTYSGSGTWPCSRKRWDSGGRPTRTSR